MEKVASVILWINHYQMDSQFQDFGPKLKFNWWFIRVGTWCMGTYNVPILMSIYIYIGE